MKSLLLTTAGALLGATAALGITSAHSEPAAPYVSSDCYEAALVVRDYNQTGDQADRAALYDAYLRTSKACLTYPRP